jgi:uncharacterized pyridoxal phosphate-containing UPF0001 family protein
MFILCFTECHIVTHTFLRQQVDAAIKAAHTQYSEQVEQERANKHDQLQQATKGHELHLNRLQVEQEQALAAHTDWSKDAPADQEQYYH